MNEQKDDLALNDSMYEISALTIRNDQLDAVTFSEKLFSDCVFVGCDFTEADLTEARFENCRFEECNLSNTTVARTRLDTVSFVGCKLLGIQFRLVNQFSFSVSFHNSVLHNCTFDGLRMSHTEWKECEIIECSFVGSELDNSSFEGSRFRETLFDGNNLESASFRNALNYEIDPHKNNLRNALFSSPEVLSLLRYLKIRIDA